MRALLLLLLAPTLALAQGPSVTRDLGSIQTGPRILGEPAFAFELDALSQDETSRPGWPVTTTRASGATCIDGHSVGANEACVSSVGLECFAAGVGGRTAADVHTVSTEGWPTDTLEIRLQYTPLAATSASDRYLLDSRDGIAGVSGFTLRIMPTGELRLFVVGFGTVTSSALSWVGGETYSIAVRLTPSSATIYRNGVVVGSGSSTATAPGHGSAATIGSLVDGTLNAGGSIRLLRVSE